MELYKKYRPQSFKEIVGQEEVIRVLYDLGKRGEIPHALLLIGPSGVGKTTIGRILRKKLKCSDHDFFEMNVADFRGIDMVRDIRERMSLSPIGGKTRVWLIDEAAKLTSDAQDAFLKILEDTPDHVYFMLATTDPQKLKPTVRTRCTELRLYNLQDTEIDELIRGVCEKEGVELSEEVREKIVEYAEGSPRKSLVLLHQVVGQETEEKQLEAIMKMDVQVEGFQIAKALMKQGTTWKEIASILKEVKEDPEQIRYIVLGYCSTVLLNPKGPVAGKAAMIIEHFEESFWNSKKAGLIKACYDVIVPPV